MEINWFYNWLCRDMSAEWLGLAKLGTFRHSIKKKEASLLDDMNSLSLWRRGRPDGSLPKCGSVSLDDFITAQCACVAHRYGETEPRYADWCEHSQELIVFLLIDDEISRGIRIGMALNLMSYHINLGKTFDWFGSRASRSSPFLPAPSTVTVAIHLFHSSLRVCVMHAWTFTPNLPHFLFLISLDHVPLHLSRAQSPLSSKHF